MFLQRNRKSWLVLSALVFVPASLVKAQSYQTVVGTITDPSDRPVASATVVLKHLLTGESRSASTDAQGDYRISGLRHVGDYEVRCEATGFKAASVPQFAVLTGATVRVDVKLDIGAVAEQVTVTADVPSVRSEVSSLSAVAENREILELPLYQRNFLGLTALSPGVSSRAPNAFINMNESGLNLAVGGGRTRDNDIRLDGVRNVTGLNNDINTRPPLDALEEFQMLRHQYAAEYGRAMGAVVEVRTKSGSNAFHGSGYWFGRRGDWAAIPYFALSQPVFKEDQYGGSIGGPVWLPKIYKGTNRTFFFFAYEKFDNPSETVFRRYLLTPEERAGDFSRSIWGTTPLDPLTGQPFPGSRIPTTRFNPAIQKVFGLLPTPNTSIDANMNWTGNIPTPTKRPQFVLRGDHTISGNHSVYVSAAWSNEDNRRAFALDCGVCANRISDVAFVYNNRTVTGGHTWVISPRIVLQSRLGYSYLKSQYDQVDRSKNWAKELGFAFRPADDRQELWGMPPINVRGFGGAYFSYFTNPTYGREEPAYNAISTITVNAGAHSVKAGADIIQDTTMGLFACGAAGAYSFGFDPRVGNQSAEFLLGVHNSSYYQRTPARAKARRWQQAYFAQDDWRITQRLTLNLGLRYDFFSPYNAPDHRVARYDFATDEVIYPAALRDTLSADVRAGLKFRHRFDGPSTSYEHPSKFNFAPRFGFAFRPFGNSSTVIRSGYGIFYASPQGFSTTRNWRVGPWAEYLPLGQSPASLTRPVMYIDKVQPELATTDYLTPGDVRMPEPGFKNAYTQQWNLTIQRAIVRDLSIEAGYVGSRGVHLDFEVWGQRYASLYGRSNFFLGDSLRVNSSGFDSRYNSLQLTLQKRYSAGYSFRLNYTYGNLMNNTPDAYSADQGGHWAIVQRNEWARSDADVRHNLNFSGIYELPFGRNRALGANWNRVTDAFLGGWKLNYLLELNSGNVINVLWGPRFRPDLVPGRNPVLEGRSDFAWFDPSAFRAPACAAPCQGNVGRNVLDGPNFRNLDLGISKLFYIRESHRIDARLEAFNSTNTANFSAGGLNVDVSQPASNRLRTVAPMRRVQIAVRYSF